MVSTLAFICFVVVVLVVLFGTTIGKRLRLRASGTAEEMIVKDASTPEGAKAYYNTAIAKKEEDYQAAHAIYAQMLGKIDGYENQLRSLKKEDMQLSLNINACIEKNDDDGAKVYLAKQQDVADKIEIIKDAITELKNNAKIQDDMLKTMFEELGNLKAEKETAVLTLETAQITKSLQATPGVYSGEEDRMLEKVRDGIKKTKEEAAGSKIAYESSTSVQQKRLDKKMKDEEIELKLQQLKAGKK
jgi:phage shock protein A